MHLPFKKKKWHWHHVLKIIPVHMEQFQLPFLKVHVNVYHGPTFQPLTKFCAAALEQFFFKSDKDLWCCWDISSSLKIDQKDKCIQIPHQLPRSYCSMCLYLPCTFACVVLYFTKVLQLWDVYRACQVLFANKWILKNAEKFNLSYFLTEYATQ